MGGRGCRGGWGAPGGPARPVLGAPARPHCAVGQVWGQREGRWGAAVGQVGVLGGSHGVGGGKAGVSGAGAVGQQGDTVGQHVDVEGQDGMPWGSRDAVGQGGVRWGSEGTLWGSEGMLWVSKGMLWASKGMPWASKGMTEVSERTLWGSPTCDEALAGIASGHGEDTEGRCRDLVAPVFDGAGVAPRHIRHVGHCVGAVPVVPDRRLLGLPLGVLRASPISALCVGLSTPGWGGKGTLCHSAPRDSPLL